MFDADDSRNNGARRFSPDDQQQQRGTRKRRPKKDFLVSEIACRIFETLKQDGKKPETVNGLRYAFYSFFEFLGKDMRLSELHHWNRQQMRAQRQRGVQRPDTLFVRYLIWLRQTPSQPRKPGSLAKEITPAAVARFFAEPPQRTGRTGKRCPRTIGSYKRTISRLIRALHCKTELPKQYAPSTWMPPVILPEVPELSAWWNECLERGKRDSKGLDVRKRAEIVRDSQRVVLMSGLLYLTGMRIGEALQAKLADCDDHWLLIPGKRDCLRIIYLSSQALGLASAMRASEKARQKLLFGDLERIAQDAARFCGWTKHKSAWHDMSHERLAGISGMPPKPNQTLRQMLTTELRDPNGINDWEAERVQMGHGGDPTGAAKGEAASRVVLESYVGAMMRLPGHLEPRQLPPLRIPWPKPIERPVYKPTRLWQEMLRLMDERYMPGAVAL
jgi:integrase